MNGLYVGAIWWDKQGAHFAVEILSYDASTVTFEVCVADPQTVISRVGNTFTLDRKHFFQAWEPSHTIQSSWGEITLDLGIPSPHKGPVCECGGAKSNTTHSSWCPMSAK